MGKVDRGVGRMPALRFQGPLYKAGTSVDALKKRLDSFHKELAALDQGAIDTSLLDDYCAELIKPSLMRHKDRSVQVLVGCILSDILRLYAPNAPFTSTEIKVRFARTYAVPFPVLAAAASLAQSGIGTSREQCI